MWQEHGLTTEYIMIFSKFGERERERPREKEREKQRERERVIYN